MVSESLDAILVEFVAESWTDLATAERSLLQHEAGDENSAPVEVTFRAVHTLKGTAACLGLHKTQRLAHAAENVLTLLREHDLELDRDTTSLLLTFFDAVRLHLTRVKESGSEGAEDDNLVIDRLQSLASGPRKGLTEAPDASVHPGPRVISGSSQVSDAGTTGGGEHEATSTPRRSSLPLREGEREASQPDGGRALVPRHADSLVRVEVALLDRLLDHVGELVLIRNRLVKLVDRHEDPELETSIRQLDRYTSALHDGVIQARLEPFDVLVGRLARQVRELARSLGKEVTFETSGMETELDRSLVEAMWAPLVHLVRNAVDHGIEAPEMRIQRGKPAQGTVRLSVSRYAGDVHIVLSDDGEGIARDGLRARALSRGHWSDEQVRGASDKQLLALIFQPGLSTAPAVSAVSGRGMGMGIVQDRVESVGGVVDVESIEGEGTTFTLSMPASLTVIPSVVVVCGGRRFGIPSAGLVDLLQVRRTELTALQDESQGVPSLVYQRANLPLVSLRRTLQIEAPPSSRERLPVLILKTGRTCFALQVDGVEDDASELVSKPLSPILGRQGPFSGATVLGDGLLALLVDLPSLARLAVHGLQPCPQSQAVEQGFRRDQRKLLVFGSAVGLLAVPLVRVVRLMRIAGADLKNTPQGLWLACDGAPLRLLDLDERAVGADEARTVMVCRTQSRRVGLLLAGSVDLFDGSARQVVGDTFPKLRGAQSVELDGRLASLLDLERFVGLVSDRSAPLS